MHPLHKPLRRYQAADVLRRVQNLPAFNVPEAVSRRKLNGTATLYTFADGSCLQINAATSRAHTWHKAWCGTADDVHLGPIHGASVSINRQGV